MIQINIIGHTKLELYFMPCASFLIILHTTVVQNLAKSLELVLSYGVSDKQADKPH